MNPNRDDMDDVVINIDVDHENPNQSTSKPVMKTILTKPTNNPNTSTSSGMRLNNDNETDAPDIKTLVFEKLGVTNSNNPFICIFHILFKVLAACTYIFSGWLFDNVFIFITVSIFAVLDFWIVKNVSGRYLVGLRWWTALDEQGREKWTFESFDTEVQVNPIDSAFFWYGQLLYSVFWCLMFVLKVLTFSLFWVS